MKVYNAQTDEYEEFQWKRPVSPVRVIRVLEYDFDNPYELEKQLARNGVNRIHDFSTNGKRIIRELVLGRETPLAQRIKIAWRIIMGRYDDLEEII